MHLRLVTSTYRGYILHTIDNQIYDYIKKKLKLKTIVSLDIPTLEGKTLADHITDNSHIIQEERKEHERELLEQYSLYLQLVNELKSSSPTFMRYYSTLVLHQQGLTYKEIAKKQSIELGTVKSRINRCKEMIKKSAQNTS